MSSYFIYNPARQLTPAEEQVKAAGYPFISTMILQRRGKGLDRLNDHRHSSQNTHLIVSGSIDIGKSRDSDFKLRRVTYHPGDWVTLPRDVDYRREAGDDGCEFVEGHTVLSPITAHRSLSRGTIVVTSGDTEGAFATCCPHCGRLWTWRKCECMGGEVESGV